MKWETDQDGIDWAASSACSFAVQAEKPVGFILAVTGNAMGECPVRFKTAEDAKLTAEWIDELLAAD
jgi:hypothetical protein